MIDHAPLISMGIVLRATLADVGLPVVEAGESGMKGARGVLVPSTSNPDSVSVLWLTEVKGGPYGIGRLQTSVTYGSVPDVNTRLGFLSVIDHAEKAGVTDLGIRGQHGAVYSLADIRAMHLWADSLNRPLIVEALLLALTGRQAIENDGLDNGGQGAPVR